MMTFAFDLISDLHVETWDPLDWTGQATSTYCVVAGDISRDLVRTQEFLTHLGSCYQAVFYIDGNDEHRWCLDNIGQSYQDLSAAVSAVPNVVYMHNSVAVINGVAILATNGWWTYDFDPNIDLEQTQSWLQDHYGLDKNTVENISTMALHDAAYLVRSVRKLQTHQEVKAIVLVTHTVPGAWIVSHDIELSDHYRYNTMGNSHVDIALDEDTEHKIKVWCFGHYHKGVDRDRNGVRYVNNCRGRGQTEWCQQAYYPKRITVEF